MKLELFLLRGLVVACVAVASLIMAAMLSARPDATQIASSKSISGILLSAPGTCALPADDVVCPRQLG